MENVPGVSWANSSLFSHQILIKHKWKLVRELKANGNTPGAPWTNSFLLLYYFIQSLFTDNGNALLELVWPMTCQPASQPNNQPTNQPASQPPSPPSDPTSKPARLWPAGLGWPRLAGLGRLANMCQNQGNLSKTKHTQSTYVHMNT